MYSRNKSWNLSARKSTLTSCRLNLWIWIIRRSSLILKVMRLIQKEKEFNFRQNHSLTTKDSTDVQKWLLDSNIYVNIMIIFSSLGVFRVKLLPFNFWCINWFCIEKYVLNWNDMCPLSALWCFKICLYNLWFKPKLCHTWKGINGFSMTPRSSLKSLETLRLFYQKWDWMCELILLS